MCDVLADTIDTIGAMPWLCAQTIDDRISISYKNKYKACIDGEDCGIVQAQAMNAPHT